MICGLSGGTAVNQILVDDVIGRMYPPIGKMGQSKLSHIGRGEIITICFENAVSGDDIFDII